MGNVVIKVLDKHYKKNDAMYGVIRYIAGEGKNKDKEVVLIKKGKGVSSRDKKATHQMIKVQRAFGKDNKRRLYHLIVSFNHLHDEGKIKCIAEDIAEVLFQRHQVYYGIHISKENWHIHFAINSVSYVDGKKWHQNRKELLELKHDIKNRIRKFYDE